MVRALRTWLVIFLLLAAETVVAFNGHIVTEGPLKLTIDDIEDVTEYDRPRDVKVTVRNNGESPLKVQLRMSGLVDEWYAVGETQKRLVVVSGECTKVLFHRNADDVRRSLPDMPANSGSSYSQCRGFQYS